MKQIDILTDSIQAKTIPSLMTASGIPFEKIATVNWPAFPECPEVRFRIAATRDAFLLHFKVKENSTIARYDQDGSPVWQDSCVEFFLQPGTDGNYYNLECNCIGNILMAVGTGRANREALPSVLLQKIKRWSSLPHECFEECIGESIWEVALMIPYEVYFKHRLPAAGLKANFYKCGDSLSQKHYLSWKPIRTEKPDFHRPEFFGFI